MPTMTPNERKSIEAKLRRFDAILARWVRDLPEAVRYRDEIASDLGLPQFVAPALPSQAGNGGRPVQRKKGAAQTRAAAQR